MARTRGYSGGTPAGEVGAPARLPSASVAADEPRYEVVRLDSLVPYPGNARLHNDEVIQASLTEHGQFRPLLVQRGTRTILGGNGTWHNMLALGMVECDVRWLDVDDRQARRIVLVDNRANDLASYDEGLLLELLQQEDDLAGVGFTEEDVTKLLISQAPPGGRGETPGLADRFLVPPFSVLDARKGWWRERKKQWLSRGIQSELGRAGDLMGRAGAAYGSKATTLADGSLAYTQMDAAGQTSVFDPVLCEIAYRWWCPPAGLILDPWAGGSVRGIVAATLGYRYEGVDLRADQVAANEAQVGPCLDADLPEYHVPAWHHGDATEWLAGLPEGGADLIFGCPPYYDLETYSEDPRDLSNMGEAEFDAAYSEQLRLAARALHTDRFAVLVVGNVRRRNGRVADLAGVTSRAMEAAGLTLYNDAILLTMVGSLAVRAGHHFTASRVLGRTHQQVLCYVKGDRKRATEACGVLDLSEAMAAIPLDDTDAIE